MRLKNKKTGEIVTLTLSTNGEDMIIMGNDMLAHITKLSELNDYEDCEEPKEYWYIDINGEIMFDNVEDDTVKVMREIGNYFETEEEAERAVEKLKAAKRLKDKGFRIDRWCNVSAGPYRPIWFYFEKDTVLEDVKSDLDLIFGDKE